MLSPTAKYLPLKLTISNVHKALSQAGIRFKRIRETNEYMVNTLDGNESTAYFTNDLQDAYQTGLRMLDTKPRKLIMRKVSNYRHDYAFRHDNDRKLSPSLGEFIACLCLFITPVALFWSYYSVTGYYVQF